MLLIYWVWNTYSLCLWGTTVHLYWGLVICWGLVNCTFPTLGTSAEWRELFSWERIDSVCVFVRDQTMANYSLTLSPSRMCWQLILTLLLWFFQNGATSVDMMTHLHENSFTWWNNCMTHLHDWFFLQNVCVSTTPYSTLTNPLHPYASSYTKAHSYASYPGSKCG